MTIQYEPYPEKTLLMMILVQTNFRKTILNQYFIKNPPNFDGFFVLNIQLIPQFF